MNTEDTLGLVQNTVEALDTVNKATTPALGAATGILGSVGGALPIVGGALAIASPIISAIVRKRQEQKQDSQRFNSTYNKVANSDNPYQLKYGGSTDHYLTDDFKKYGGKLHEFGGVGINAKGLPISKDIEVERGETSVTLKNGKTYVFSNSIII